MHQESEEAGDDDGADDAVSAAGAGASAPLPPPIPSPAPPAPDTQLSLEWVYGYSAATSRSSVGYAISTVGGGIGVVYPAGKVAVVLSQPVDEDGVETEGGLYARTVAVTAWHKN